MHVSQIMTLVNPRQGLSRLLILSGAGIVALAFGADLIGGTGGVGPLQVILASIGFAILFMGAILDLTLGQRYLFQWLKPVVADRASVAKFLSITAQLGILVLVIRQFELESQAFYNHIMLLTFFGFLVNHFLPRKYRLPFFLLLSLAGISGLFGFPDGAWLIVSGLVLIGFCHLPVPFSARIALLLIAGAFFASLRVGWIHASWSGVVLPVLASMFMFRLIVYLHDLKHRKEPVKILQTLSYFFLLPNLVFPLFPVVDYKTFCRTYYNDDAYRIYQTGVKWMLRGVIHLLVYRLVSYYFVISPEEIGNVNQLAQYLVTNFLLLVRISGQFHLVVGMLHLFGFNLPRPWHLFYLAFSFNEFWRRSNIYWKDFMQDVFFYPVYFRLRNWGTTPRLVLSTLAVFVVTWFLHAYQWFWLRGSILLSAPDLLFWSVFGLLVIANSLYELKYGRKRTLGKHSWTPGEIVSRAVSTLATFSVICVLWSLWSTPSLSAWFSMWSAAGVTLASITGFVPILLVGALAFLLTTFVVERLSLSDTEKDRTRSLSFFRIALVSGFPILLLFLLGNPKISTRIGGKGAEIITNLRTNQLSLSDAALLERGYYENLTELNRFNTKLWQLYMKKPKDWAVISKTDATRLTGDFLGMEFVPSTSIIFHGVKLSTNRWGMRDRDYQKIPSADTYRIALLGGSMVMGSGVADNETFECVLEKRLNSENDTNTYASCEILNFGVGGYGPIRRLMALEKKALLFKPNAVFSVAHTRDYYHAISLLVRMSQRGVDIPYQHLREIVRKAGIDAKTSEVEAVRRLRPFGDEIVAWSYRRTAEICRQHSLVPVWILLPSGVGVREDENSATLTRYAEEAGFIVLNLMDIYENQDAEKLRVAAWDWHPNSRGHTVIADRLYNELLKNEILLAHVTQKTFSAEPINGNRSGSLK